MSGGRLREQMPFVFLRGNSLRPETFIHIEYYFHPSIVQLSCQVSSIQFDHWSTFLDKSANSSIYLYLCKIITEKYAKA